MTNENKQPVINEFSENELLTRYRSGNEDAFCEIVTRYSDTLYTFLRRFNRLEDVEDVFQETFLKLYTTQDSFDTNHPLMLWLLTVAANKAKDARQKMPRQSPLKRPLPTRSHQ